MRTFFRSLFRPYTDLVRSYHSILSFKWLALGVVVSARENLRSHQRRGRSIERLSSLGAGVRRGSGACSMRRSLPLGTMFFQRGVEGLAQGLGGEGFSQKAVHACGETALRVP